MIKVSKIRIYPNRTQTHIINRILGACRFIRNKFIEINRQRYNDGNSYIGGYDFSKALTKLKKKDSNYAWLKDISSKAIKDAIMIQDKAYRNFFKKVKNKEKTHPPRFISRKYISSESYFFIKDNIHYIPYTNHIHLPILGNMKIRQYKDVPEVKTITSGRIIKEGDKYYVMFIYKKEPTELELFDYGIGVDVGIKNYCTLSFTDDNRHPIVHTFIHDTKLKELYERYEKLQRVISHKVEINYGKLLHAYMDKHRCEPNEKYKNIMKGESYKSNKISRIRKKMRLISKKISNYRKDKICKICNLLTARLKPKYITIEDLSVSKMIKNIFNAKNNHHELHDMITKSAFFIFRTQLVNKCHEYGIEIRLADKFYASSKKCCVCGHKKDDLKLTDRIYHCEKCGNEIDRDVNASINLLNLKKYHLA